MILRTTSGIGRRASQWALPLWRYSDSVPLADGFSRLEADLRAGRTAAAAAGYHAGPDCIEVYEVMLSVDGREYLSLAEMPDNETLFTATHMRLLMTWNADKELGRPERG